MQVLEGKQTFAQLTRGVKDRIQCFVKRGADEGVVDRDIKARANIVEY